MQRFPRAPILARIVAFVWIPALLLWVWFAHQERSGHEQRLQETEDELREVLDRTAILGNPDRRYRELLQRLVDRRVGLPSVAAHAGRLCRREGVLEIIVFNRDRELVAVPGLPAPPRAAAQRVLGALIDGGESKHLRIAGTFVGSDNAVRAMAQAPDTMVPLASGFKRWAGGWWRLRDRRNTDLGWLVAFVRRDPIPTDRAVVRAVADARRLVGRQFTIGWFDPVPADGRVRIRPANASWPADTASRCLAVPPGLDRTTDGKQHIVLRPGNRGEIYIGTVAQPPAPPSGWWRLVIPAATLLLTLFVGAAGTGILAVSPGLRVKLLTLLVTGAALLLTALLTTALIDRNDRELLLIDEIQERHLRQLEKIDRDAPIELFPLIDQYDRIVRIASYQAITRLQPALNHLRSFLATRRHLVLGFVCVASGGKVLSFDGGSPVRRTGIAGDVSSRQFITKIAHGILSDCISYTRLSEGSKMKGENVLAALLSSTLFWNHHNGNRITTQNVGGMAIVTYVAPIVGANGKAQALILALHNSQAVQQQCLRHWIERLGRPHPDEPRLGALPLQGSVNWPVFPHARVADQPLLRRLRDQVQATQLPQHVRGLIRGREHLITGLPGRNLDGYMIYLAQPFHTVRRQTDRLNRQLALLTALVLAVVIGVGSRATGWLLSPVAELERGLGALSAGKFSHRVGPAGVVEFERLGEQLNLIMDDLRDLQIARNVQDHLWPGTAASGPGWSVAGQCRTAANLGGDYFDWLTTPDGRTVVAIGDVAGHGIPASLVTAAAKVELALAAPRLASPAEILAVMNNGFREQAGRARPMSFWLAVFNPVDGLLRYAGAGHPYAVLLPADGDSALLGFPALPLGAGRRPNYTEGSVIAAPGARLVLYTDGIIEAPSAAGELFGYDRLREVVTAHRHETAPHIVAAVLAAARAWCPLDPPPDDQTVVVLAVDPIATGAGATP